MLSPGDRLGRYEVVSSLGVGGMGEVYRAWDTELEREVALKVLPEAVSADPARLRRFEREARAVAALNHPNVITIHDVGQQDGVVYLVSELLEGETLRMYARRRHLLPPRALEVALEVTRGLEAAHEKGVLHRDITPRNVFVGHKGGVKVLDFGLAKIGKSTPAGSRTKTATPDSTSPGQLVGTVGYMSPEQARGLDLDARTDIFSVGVVLHELLSGRHPFLRGNEVATLSALLEEEPPDLSSSGAGVSPAVAMVVKRCLAKNREDRYGSAHDLVVALEAVLGQPTLPARVAGVEERSPYPGLRSFGEEDAERFFGRETEVDALWARIEQRHLLAVIGPSGVGKTSFVRAGVAASRPTGWAVLVCTPGSRPLRSLGQALVPELSGDTEALRRLVALDDAEAAFELVVRWRRRHGDALLVVDQLEELFTQCEPPARSAFAELLGRLAGTGDVRVLVSLRDDFLIRCAEHEGLEPVFESLTPLPPLEAEALRRAVIEPAARQDYRFEDEALVEEMLGELEGTSGALPLLAFAVSRLWEKRDRERRVLTRAAYEAMGGVAGALAQHAEGVLDRLGSDKQPIVRELFRNLVMAQGTRAVVDREELLSVFPDRKAAEGVLRALIDARLLTSSEVEEVSRPPGSHPGGSSPDAPAGPRSGAVPGDRAPRASGRRIEVVHEFLLKAWPRLVMWQAQEQEGAVLRDQLRQAAHLWAEKGRPHDLLWTGTSFLEFQTWRTRYPGRLSATEEEFAGAMEELGGRRRRRRRMAAAAAVLALVVGLAGVTALWARSEASRRQAEAEARRAEAGKLLVLGRTLLREDPSAALAYTLESLRLADSPEARRFALEVLWEGPTRIQVTGRHGVGVAFSTDGRWLARWERGAPFPGAESLALWPRDGGTPQVFPGEGQTDFAIGPRSGPLMISVGRREEPGAKRGLALLQPTVLRFRTLSDGKLIRTLPLEGFTKFAVRRDVPLLLTATVTERDRESDRDRLLVRSWPLEGGGPTELGHVDSTEVRLWSISVDPSGRWAWASTDNRIFVGPAEGPLMQSRRLVGRQDSVVLRTRFHPDGERLASFGANGEIRLHRLAGDGPSRVIPGPRRRRGSRRIEAGVGTGILEFSPDGSTLLAGQGRFLSLWDLAPPLAAEPLVLRTGEEIRTHDAVFDPGGLWLASAGGDHTSIWPLSRPYARVLRAEEGAVVGIEFDPRGRWLVSAALDSTVRLWSLCDDGGAPTRPLFNDGGLGWTDLDVDPDGRSVILGGPSGRVWVVPVDGEAPRRMPGFTAQISAVAFGPRGRLVAAAGGKGNPAEAVIRVWDLESGDVRVLDPGDGKFLGWWLRFTADGRLVSSGDAGVRLWDVEKGTFEVLNPDADRFVASRWPTRLCAGHPDRPDPWSCHDLESGRTEVLDLRSHRRALAEFVEYTFSPDGTVLVTGDTSGVVSVGPANGAPPHLLLGHEGAVNDVTVSPDGRWIASAGYDGSIRLWPMPDVGDPPLHTLPHDALLAKLQSLTNLRAVEDEDSPSGYRIEAGPFPGWETVPTW